MDDIAEIDKNFKMNELKDFNSSIYKIPNEHFSLYGCYYDEEYGFIKMAPQIAGSISEGVLRGSRCTDGVRLLFSTNSKMIEITVNYFSKCLMHHMPLIASAGFTLCEVREGKEFFVGNFIPPTNNNEFFVSQLQLLGGQMRDYILYFPLYSGVESLDIRLEEGSKVEKYEKYCSNKPILYYGSSITQGGCASRVDNCYQAYVSQWTNTDYYILGFSGNAKGEREMAETIRDINCCVFVCDYDHNAPTVDHLRDTHLPLYKTFREKEANKKIPIIFISRPNDFYSQETKERFEIINQTYLYAKSIGDNNVSLIDGREIYPIELREHCSVDGTHPNDLGFYYIAKRIYDIMLGNNLTSAING